MLSVTDDDVFIAPQYKDAAKIAKMIRKQGDGRGFILNDQSIIIFNSYGNTHSSMIKYFGLDSRKSRLRVDLCIIFRLQEIFIDCELPGNKSRVPVELFFGAEDAKLMLRIYELMNTLMGRPLTVTNSDDNTGWVI